MEQFYTYLHCRPDGTPFYVGKGKGKRYKEFRRRNSHHSHLIEKYGRKNIKIFVFPCESEDQAFADEIQQIAKLKQDGYELVNYTDGGEGISGFRHSENTKISLSIKNSGRKHTEEERVKMSEFQKGRKHTLETRKKMSEKLKGNQRWLGKKHKPETKEKIAQSNRTRILSPETGKKISEANRGRKASAEARAKMSESHKLRWAIKKMENK